MAVVGGGAGIAVVILVAEGTVALATQLPGCAWGCFWMGLGAQKRHVQSTAAGSDACSQDSPGGRPFWVAAEGQPLRQPREKALLLATFCASNLLRMSNFQSLIRVAPGTRARQSQT